MDRTFCLIDFFLNLSRFIRNKSASLFHKGIQYSLKEDKFATARDVAKVKLFTIFLIFC